MNYLNDLGQTGLDEQKRLRLFWPWSKHTILQLNSDQPNWTKLLEDGQNACCFAVTVNRCLEYDGVVTRFCRWSGSLRDSHAAPSKGPLLLTSISLRDNPTVSLPLRLAGIVKMDAGCLTIAGGHRKRHAQLAIFWTPNALDRTNELLDASDGERLGARTHAEFLDRERDTGLSVDVCIMDWREKGTVKRDKGIIMSIVKALIPTGWL